jgi:hypothetical protein
MYVAADQTYLQQWSLFSTMGRRGGSDNGAVQSTAGKRQMVEARWLAGAKSDTIGWRVSRPSKNNTLPGRAAPSEPPEYALESKLRSSTYSSLFKVPSP